MPYQVELTRAAARALEQVPNSDRARIARRIDALAENPRPAGCRKLSGEGDLFRVRSGDYRIVYQVEDRVLTVLVIRIGHRRDVYR